jgi:hypothetical protein
METKTGLYGITYRMVSPTVGYSLHTCSHVEDEMYSGALVGFDIGAENECVGGISWCPECNGPTWELHSIFPLHVEPSIACRTHPEHHGWIRNDRWEQA